MFDITNGAAENTNDSNAPVDRQVRPANCPWSGKW